MSAFSYFRPRRMRRDDFSRRLMRENVLTTNDLIYPVFIVEGTGINQPIASMPGVERVSVDRLMSVAEQCVSLGVPVLSLFPAIDAALKTPDGIEATNPEGLIPRAVRELKKRFPELGVLTDVALDPYTSHGQDGVLDADGYDIHDETPTILVPPAPTPAQAAEPGAVGRPPAGDERADAAPAELSTICNVMPAPPLPFLPADVHGKLVAFSMLAFAGDAAAAARAIAPFRALGPIVDMVKPGPYTGMFPPEDPNYHPTAAAWTMFMNRVDGPAAKTIVDTLSSSSSSFAAVQLRVLGGAVAQIPVDATAYAHRASPIMAHVLALYTPDDKARQEDWVKTFAAALRQDDAGAYVNFLGAEGAERVRSAYPGRTWDRLQAVKAKYDPDNLFRLNQNIVPMK